jgi:hypothetical protein
MMSIEASPEVPPMQSERPGEVAAAAKTPLLETAVPRLVPLETLAGRNHYTFPRSEEPPWRWRVDPVYPG